MICEYYCFRACTAASRTEGSVNALQQNIHKSYITRVMYIFYTVMIFFSYN